MDWTEITVTVPQEKTEQAAAIANMTVPYGIYIEDYSDLEQEAMEIAHIDLIDKALIDKDRKISIIHIYISECDNATEALEFMKQRLSADNIKYEIESINVNDSDWNENWKKYFHSFKVGERLAIVPSWEHYNNIDNRVILKIDPGAAFGTGTHATTFLCLSMIEKYIKEDYSVLDIGSGSGILSIASVLLGANNATGVDIDAQSVKTANENAAINSVETKTKYIVGNLADKIVGKYDIICANIVADVIIDLLKTISKFMKNNTVFIISGIIDIRKDDVKKAIDNNRFLVVDEKYKDNWCAFALKKSDLEDINA